MQTPEAQDIIELLHRVAEIKTRLRQLESARTIAAPGDAQPTEAPAPGALVRARNHLELALEALGTPTWGFASTPASSLKITGFYSSDIYKALKDIRSQASVPDAPAQSDDAAEEATPRSKTGNRRTGSPAGRRKADRMAQRWNSKNKKGKKKRSAPNEAEAVASAEEVAEGTQAPTIEPVVETAAEAPIVQLPEPVAEEAEGGGSSVWVQHRVDEIQRALTAAFGDDEAPAEPEPELAPKPFAAPEFIGNTDALSVPELIGFFQLQGKTGVLTIDARQEQFSLEYLRGELIHACSSSSPDGHRLGEVLVKLGHLTQSKLERLLAGKSSAERLGDALRRGEVVGEDALAEALQYQIQNIFYRLFDLGGCRFTFREGLEGEPSARVRYNVTRLLLETARHRDELEGSAERQAG